MAYRKPNNMNYYLINNRVMKGGEMPKRSSFQNAFWNKEDFNYWYISLQPCEISESELKKIKMAFILSKMA
ncbi:MAG TPA: hypothetical protein PLL99_07320, partial [Chitinophagales bacterium]|nr:hypothetical protein [Chitinophagales bacterium]